MTTALIIIIVFVATLFRSTFGFGMALIAVPMLTLILPLEVVVPLCVMASILMASIMILQDHPDVHFSSAMWLFGFGLMGIPVGLAILIHGNERIVKPLLGGLVILYSVYSLAGRGGFRLEKDSKLWLFVCGFSSGVIGGAYGLDGPPLIVYGNLRRWSARHFKATLQAYFLPASIIGMVGYWYNGLWTGTVSYYFLLCLPAMIPAIILGRYLNRRIDDRLFYRYIYIGLIVVGVGLIMQSLSLSEVLLNHD